MNRLLLVAKTALCLAATALLLSVAWLAVSVRAGVDQTADDEHALAIHAQDLADDEADHLNAALDRIAADFGSAASDVTATQADLHVLLRSASGTLAIVNRGCETKDANGGTLPCGTLAEVAKTLATYRGTAGQVEAALHHENQLLDRRDAQEVDLYQRSSAALGSAQQSLADLDGALKPLSHTAQLMDKRLTPILDRPPCKGSWCWAKKAWPYIRGGAELAEPSYWTYELLKSAGAVR